jgi:hypothetical protein
MFNPTAALAEFYHLGNATISVHLNMDNESLIFEGWDFGNICYDKWDNGRFEIWIKDLEYTRRFDTLNEAVEAMDWIAEVRAMDNDTLIGIYTDWGAMGSNADCSDWEFQIVEEEVWRRDA